MSNKKPYRYARQTTRPCEASTGKFKCDIDMERLKALGGDDLSLMGDAANPKPRRTLDDMRRLSEEIKRNRQAQKQTSDAPESDKRKAVAEDLLKRTITHKK